MRLRILTNRSGNILIMSIAAMFLVTAAMVGVLMITANALHLSDKQRDSASAFNISESGLEAAGFYLKGLSIPPSGTAAFDPFGGAQALDVGTYQVTIYPAATNATQFLKSFRIVSVGKAYGRTKTLELVLKQASFGKYAYFTDKETSSVSGGTIWWKAGELVDGPVHSNNTGGANFSINYNGSTSPIFLDMVTGSGSSISYNPSKPTKESTFTKIFKDGSKGFKLGVPTIALPSSTDTQKNAAWGASSGFPSTNGVYLRAGTNGGLYVRGDCTMTLSVNASGNQVMTIVQGSNTTVVTYNKATQSISATGTLGSGSASSASSLGTGVVYCTGNITALKGTVADNSYSGGKVTVASAMTIANDVNAGKYMKIADNLVYKTRPDKTKAATDTVNLAAGTLGLVSKDIKISSTAPQNLEIDAVCLAGGQNTTDGSFYVENYSSKSPVGTLKVLGGIIQKARGPVGTFNSSTGQTTYGYSKNYSYDPRLATNPPPFYPTTGTYQRLSWQMLPNQ